MKFHKDMLLLYGVTDPAFTGEKTLTEQIEEALCAGVTLLQLREKSLDKSAFLEEALLVRELTKHYGIPLIINDDVDIALKCGADGVHVGQDDLSPLEVRRLIGPDRILGVTAKNVSQAKKAFMDGADYIGSGAIFPSPTKKDAIPLTLEQLSAICRSVPIPVTAIGGINSENVSSLKGTGVAGAAVVSGIFGQKDITAAVHRLKEQLLKVVSP
ncbi:MAG TPA: thiamine phosphate synthase [Lachnoclostridium sp.]|uniref:thiamine phosphate synthase n=1 Tax=Lacrimispora sp. TaxID=2719234 RepID=UPI000ECB673F|nr:thiamine phosphate synthase [Lacrimispora sp.]HCD43209.1 thiamine phosphate synthase [Lachnoclostridium sp.]